VEAQKKKQLLARLLGLIPQLHTLAQEGLCHLDKLRVITARSVAAHPSVVNNLSADYVTRMLE